MKNQDELHLPTGDVIGTPVHACETETAIQQISTWAVKRESRCVVFCNVHSVASALINRAFRESISKADLRLPDGAPIAFVLRKTGQPRQQRLCGPDLMRDYLSCADARAETIFLYGSSKEVLEKLRANLAGEFRRLTIATYSPPFRELTKQEDEEIVQMINRSGAQTIWVALGCPKQEQWMVEHKDRIQAVMLGVGAAFAFHAGLIRRAPLWMQNSGLEWLHRLWSDPKRLWKRYLVTNTIFVLWATKQLAKHSLTGRRTR